MRVSIFPAIFLQYGFAVHSELIYKQFIKVRGAASEHAAYVIEVDVGIPVDPVFVHESFEALEEFV